MPVSPLIFVYVVAIPVGVYCALRQYHIGDNFFFDERAARYPEKLEDEPPRYYLCHEYPTAHE
jgi:hypothetical protein